MSTKITATVTAPCGHPLDVAVDRRTGLKRSLHTFDPITRTCPVDKAKYRLRVTVRPDAWPSASYYAIAEVRDVTSSPFADLTITDAERVDSSGETVAPEPDLSTPAAVLRHHLSLLAPDHHERSGLLRAIEILDDPDAYR